MHLQESGEMYLEAILVLAKKSGFQKTALCARSTSRNIWAFQSRASAVPSGFSNRAAIFSWTRKGI